MIEDHRRVYDALTDPPVDADTFATLMCDVEDTWEAFVAARSVRDDALHTRDALIMATVRELGRNRVAALASLSRERVGQIVVAHRNQWNPTRAETDIDVLQRALTRRTRCSRPRRRKATGVTVPPVKSARTATASSIASLRMGSGGCWLDPLAAVAGRVAPTDGTLLHACAVRQGTFFQGLPRGSPIPGAVAPAAGPGVETPPSEVTRSR